MYTFDEYNNKKVIKIRKYIITYKIREKYCSIPLPQLNH